MIAFVHIWKTAGTTFTQLLRRHYGLRHFDRPGFRHRPLTADHLRRIRWVYPALHSIGGHPVRPHTDLHQAAPGIRYHTFLRDPIDRAISHFTWFLRWKAHDGVLYDHFGDTLRAWAAAPENRNLQCRFLHPEATADAALRMLDHHPFLVLRVDHFDASLLLFRHWAGEPSMNLRYLPRNTAADKYERIQDSHPAYLDRIRGFRQRLREEEPLRDILHEANREDRELVDHAFATHSPRQEEAYAGDMASDTRDFQRMNAQTTRPATEPWTARLYRDAVFKPLRPLLLPVKELPGAETSEWL